MADTLDMIPQAEAEGFAAATARANVYEDQLHAITQRTSKLQETVSSRSWPSRQRTLTAPADCTQRAALSVRDQDPGLKAASRAAGQQAPPVGRLNRESETLSMQGQFPELFAVPGQHGDVAKMPEPGFSTGPNTVEASHSKRPRFGLAVQAPAIARGLKIASALATATDPAMEAMNAVLSQTASPREEARNPAPRTGPAGPARNPFPRREKGLSPPSLSGKGVEGLSHPSLSVNGVGGSGLRAAGSIISPGAEVAGLPFPNAASQSFPDLGIADKVFAHALDAQHGYLADAHRDAADGAGRIAPLDASTDQPTLREAGSAQQLFQEEVLKSAALHEDETPSLLKAIYELLKAAVESARGLPPPPAATA